MANRNSFRLASGELAKVTYTQQPQQANRTVQERPTGLLEQAAGGLLNLTQQVGQGLVQRGAEEAYIEGVRAVSIGKKVEEVARNPLVKPFVQGGHNDQTYRTALVEASRKVDAFIMGEGRSLAPNSEEWNEYISNAFDSVHQQYGKSLSQRQRQALTDLGLRSEEQLREKQSQENQKYIFETTAESLGAMLNQTTLRLDEVGRGAYNVKHEASDILQQIDTSELPKAQRRDLLLLMANNVGERMHPELAKELLKSPLVTGADAETQTKAQRIVDAAFNKTELRDGLEDIETYERLEAGVESGVYGVAEIREFHDSVTRPGRYSHITSSQIHRLFRLANAKPPANKLAAYGDAWVRGRSGVEIAARQGWEHKNIQEGADDQYLQLRADDPSAAVAITLQVAPENGVWPKEFIKDVDKSLQVFLDTDTLSPTQALVLTPAITKAKALHENGNDAAVTQFLQHFDNDTQALLHNAITGVGSSTESALRNARDMLADTERARRVVDMLPGVDWEGMARAEAPNPYRLTHALRLRQSATHQREPEFLNTFIPEVVRRAQAKVPQMAPAEAIKQATAEVRADTMQIRNASGLSTVPLRTSSNGRTKPFLEAVQAFAEVSDDKRIVTVENLGRAIAKAYPGGDGILQSFTYTGNSLRLWERNKHGEIITQDREVDPALLYAEIVAAENIDAISNYTGTLPIALQHPNDINLLTGDVPGVQTFQDQLPELGAWAAALELQNNVTQNIRSDVASMLGNVLSEYGDMDATHDKLLGISVPEPTSINALLDEVNNWGKTGKMPESAAAAILVASELDARNPVYRKSARMERIKDVDASLPTSPHGSTFTVYDAALPRGQRKALTVALDGINSVGIDNNAVIAWRQHIAGHEGFQSKDYPDAQGRSIGFGHYLGSGSEARGEVWTLEQATEQLVKDTDKALNQADALSEELGLGESASVKLFLASMIYQLGAQGTRKFEQSLLRLQNFDVIRYDEFLRELRNSDWYKQTPQRVLDVAKFVEPLFYEDD